MIYYTADLHFGHANAITFDSRPFSSVEEMNKTLMFNWNARVLDTDIVYVIGDFAFKLKNPEELIKSLKGHKHLIRGNHDHKLKKQALDCFESVNDILLIKDGDKSIHLCHYPLAEWYDYFRGSWHIHGHIHGSRNSAFEFLRNEERALNAGCMLNNYIPVTFDELVINNKLFKEKESIK